MLNAGESEDSAAPADDGGRQKDPTAVEAKTESEDPSSGEPPLSKKPRPEPNSPSSLLRLAPQQSQLSSMPTSSHLPMSTSPSKLHETFPFLSRDLGLPPLPNRPLGLEKDRLLNLVTELNQQKHQRELERQRQRRQRQKREREEQLQQQLLRESSRSPSPITDEAVEEKDGASGDAASTVQAALAALQAGQLSLSQVSKRYSFYKPEVYFQLSVQLMALGAQQQSSPGLFQSQLAAVAARQLQQQSSSPPPPPTSSASGILPPLDLQAIQQALQQQQQTIQQHLQNLLILQQAASASTAGGANSGQNVAIPPFLGGSPVNATVAINSVKEVFLLRICRDC